MGVHRHSVLIRARPDHVWRVYVDPRRIPEWQTGSPTIENVTGAAGEIGSTYVSRRGRLVARTTVENADQPHLLVTTTNAYLGLRLDVLSTLEPTAEGTRLELRAQTYWPRGLRLAGRLVELAILSDREATKELGNLQRLVEDEAAAGSGPTSPPSPGERP